MKEPGSHTETHSPQISMMMGRVLLGVLSLSGWLVPSVCLLRQYHYVADLKTWTEAVSYCKRTYTDLASIESTEDMNQLKNTVSSSGNSSEVWIGLYSAVAWRRSDGYRGTGSEYRNWTTIDNEPNFMSGVEFCVLTYSDGSWTDHLCYHKHPFLCYRGMNWSSTQRFCRENYTDLATVRNHTENQEIHSGNWGWIGLFRDPHLNWSDGTNYKFSYWDSGFNPLGSLSHVCAVVALHRSGKWRAVSCERRLPFVCYSIPPAVKRQVVRLRMKPEDSSGSQ
ncbi:macrophage mannose receptor 1-like [Sebastes fasciatus]|uniref:macrophage mannose receptor 1-like n=1 Tax=Sebastes fasciatus TaxID=394691 RepID=UPI003D9F24AF